MNSNIKRWHFNDFDELVPSDDGEFVLYTDCEKLEAKVDRLRADMQRLLKKLPHVDRKILVQRYNLELQQEQSDE